MKKIIFSLGVILMTLSSFGKSISESKVPVLVKASFYNANPSAQHVKWELTKGNNYKAAYNLDNTHCTTYYNENGEFIESDVNIAWKDVPFTGRMEVYHSGKNHVTNVQKITNQKHDILYQIEMKSNLKKYTMLLDNEGNLIRSY